MRELDLILVCLEMYLLMIKPNPKQPWFMHDSLKERKNQIPVETRVLSR